LLIDDDRDTLDAYTRYFEFGGMCVTTATGLTEGHAHVRRLHPDLLITEVRFGGSRGGIDLIRAIRPRYSRIII
jgi:DNA-binding response OmpR family regulator